jgi:hypothetical protein
LLLIREFSDFFAGVKRQRISFDVGALEVLYRVGENMLLSSHRTSQTFRRAPMTTSPLRFGIWAVVHGPRAAHQDPEEPYDASWERNRDLVLAAEELGYDSTLIAQHTINPHQEDLDQLEAWSAAAAIAARTNRN